MTLAHALDPVGHVESPLVDATRIKVKNLEALNGTPVLDLEARSGTPVLDPKARSER